MIFVGLCDVYSILEMSLLISLDICLSPGRIENQIYLFTNTNYSLIWRQMPFCYVLKEMEGKGIHLWLTVIRAPIKGYSGD